MKIGIVGSEGVVGNACKFGFQKNGHEVICHDILLGTSIKDVVDTELVFICVPTPSKDDGSCDTSIVESVVEEIFSILSKGGRKWTPIIAIKSTITPGTTERLEVKFPELKFAFVPEFLRERCAITDFTENQDLLVIGTDDDIVFNKIKEVHGKFPKNVVHLSSIESEFVKYYNNAFGATRVVFANSMYEICKKYNVDYTKVKNAVVNIKHIPDYYLEVNDNIRGYSGVCYEKDIPALASMCDGTNVEFFKNLIKENEKYKKTVFGGMRNK